MSNIFDSLGMGGSIDVHVCVSPSSGLEMTMVDGHGNVKSYAQVPLSYNEAQREITDYNELKVGLETLFQSRNINPKKANVYLSLPTVWFGLKEGLPLLLDDSAITNIVVGELEQSYIFKRKEPLPCWFDALASSNSDSRSVFYTAVQADVVDKIREILAEMGASLISVSCSLFADLKGLYATGYASAQMNDDTNSWSMMIVNNSGYQLLGMQGKRILEYFQEPLPLKTYEGEEIYEAIENSAQIALMSTPSSSLVVISETDLVSAEILAKRLQFGGSVIAVEDNQFKKEPLMEMSLNIVPEDQIKVSLHSIGATAPNEAFPIVIDFLSASGQKSAKVDVLEIPLGNDKVLTLTPSKATIIAGIILALVLVPVGGLKFITEQLYNQQQAKSEELDAQMTALDSELQKYESADGKVVFDPIAEIENVLKNNRTKIMAYAALGESIPKNLYLTYFMTGDDGVINIKGCADSVEDVYVFFKNLKDSMVESKLRLSKLDLKTGSLDNIVNSTISTIDNAPYVFEITNMSDSQLKIFMSKLSGDSKNSSGADNNGNTDNNADGTAGAAPAN
ncbi:hypothetical protein HDR58_03200 [bacterium]|nr:hypothetical protein [bacterium]